jgi:hypothetical protein
MSTSRFVVSTIRNITDNGRPKVLVGLAPVFVSQMSVAQFLREWELISECDDNTRENAKLSLLYHNIAGIPTDRNVRDQLDEWTDVHDAIESTLIGTPDEFYLNNSGITIIASTDAKEVVGSEQRLVLTSPQLINGAQTAKVIRKCVSNIVDGVINGDIDQEELDKLCSARIKYEAIVGASDTLIGDITVSRNFQNQVKRLSILGAQGCFSDLQSAISADAELNGVKLRIKETDRDDCLETGNLIQVITASLPLQLYGKRRKICPEAPEPSLSYKLDRCLRAFHFLKSTNDLQDIYQYYIDIISIQRHL